MSRVGRSEAIRILEKRVEYLAKRIMMSDKNLSFDKVEKAALDYAIRTLKDERDTKQKLFKIVGYCNKHNEQIWADEIRHIALERENGND